MITVGSISDGAINRQCIVNLTGVGGNNCPFKGRLLIDGLGACELQGEEVWDENGRGGVIPSYQPAYRWYTR